MPFTSESGIRTDSDRERESRYGMMAVNTKVFGKMTWPMGKEG